MCFDAEGGAGDMVSVSTLTYLQLVRFIPFSYGTSTQVISLQSLVWKNRKNTNVTSWCNTFTGVIASAAAMSLVLGIGVTELMMSYNVCTTFAFVLAHQNIHS